MVGDVDRLSEPFWPSGRPPQRRNFDNRMVKTIVHATVPAGRRTFGGQSIALSVGGNWARNVQFSRSKQGEQQAVWGLRIWRGVLADFVNWRL